MKIDCNIERLNIKYINNIFHILTLVYFVVTLNQDLTNNFFINHGVQILLTLACVYKKPSINVGPIFKMIYIYYFVLFISSYLSKDIFYAVRFTVYILMVFIPLALIYNTVNSLEELTIILKLFIIASAINAIYLIYVAGWFNYIGNITEGLQLWAANTTSKRYALALIILAFINKLKGDYAFSKVAFVLYGVTFCYILAFCGSRGALILVAFSILCDIFAKKERFRIKVMKFITLITVFYGIYLMMIYNDALFSILGKRLIKFGDLYQYGGLYAAENERILLILEGLRLFVERPLFGYGYNGFILNTDFGASNLYSHNDYIECLVEIGIIGFICYYSIYLFFVMKYRLLVKKEPFDTSILFGALLGLMIFNMVSITRYDISAMIMILTLSKCYTLKKNYIYN